MSGIHQKVKFGDLIYLEIEDKFRYSLSSQGFSLKKKSLIEVNTISIENNKFYLKDFENNLFLIFPPMSENFLFNKTILDERVHLLNQKLEFATNLLNESESKNDMNLIINKFQEIKKEVYTHNIFLRDHQIGKSIKFCENFILIHLRSQMIINSSNTTKNEKNKIILSDNYTDDSIFHFFPYNKYDKEESEVYCNQNIFIRRSERNIWANNPYLYYTESNGVNYDKKLFSRVRSNAISNKKKKTQNFYQLKKFTLLFSEDHEMAKPFQVKICSKYIDPSSTNLSFSNPFWIVCQSLDKYLMINLIKNNNLNHSDNVSQSKNSNNLSHTPSISNLENLNNYSINFHNLDREKTVNNIYGLFNVEQLEEDSILNEMKLSAYIEFNKVILLRHMASKKYLGFVKDKFLHISNKFANNENKSEINSDKKKTFGKLVLKDIPDDDCEWMFMESYKILNRENYEKAKMEGMGFNKKKMFDKNKSAPDNKNNLNNETNLHDENYSVNKNKTIVKKKEILRIFHLKSMKFLSFEDVEDINNETDVQDNLKSNISLNKLPLDNDLIRLLPSNESQSWEIHLILFFYETLDNLVNKCIKNDFRNLMKNEINNSNLDKKLVMNTITEENEEIDLEKEIKENKGKLLVKEKEIEINKENKSTGFMDNIQSNISKSLDKLQSIKFGFMNGNKIKEENNDLNSDNTQNHSDLEKSDNSDISRNIINNQHNLDKTNKSIQSEKSNITINNLDNLKTIKENWMDLKILFESLSDFCLNKYNKRYDYTVTCGKPVYYRQVFIYEQGFLEKTLIFLSNAKIYLAAYKEFIKISEQNSLKITNNTRNSNKRKSKNLDDNLTTKKFKKLNTIMTNKNNQIKEELQSEIISELFKEMNKTIINSFEFLSAACKSNQQNKEFIFNNRELFWEYILIFKEAAQCLIGIIKDDENYMSELIQENISTQINNKITNKINHNLNESVFNDKNKKVKNNLIDSLIDFLNDSPHYDKSTLALLSKLMKSKNKGITSNQEHIYHSLIEKKKDNFLLKITPKFNDSFFYIVYRLENGEFEYRNLIDLCKTKNTLSDYDTNIVQYLSTQLNMYADMCYDRNYVCIEKIREIFPLDHLIYHIANIELHEEILVGLINLLNYAYIDIAPHSEIIYPNMIKIVKENLKIEKTDKYTIQTPIPLDKLNLILCISLYILSNIKNDKLLVNTANINLIFNLISFRLYENVEFNQENNINQNGIINLKEDVKKFIQDGEKEISEFKNLKNLKNNKFNKNSDKENETLESFYNKIGHKFLNYNYDEEISSEFIIFVINYLNEFFLEKVIIDNVDSNMENKNIIAETFKAISKQDLLTQNNMNYLMKIMTEIKQILTLKVSKKKNKQNLLVNDLSIYSNGNDSFKNKLIIPIIKQIYKVIDFVINIKVNDMIDNIIENMLSENNIIVKNVKNQFYKPNIEKNNERNVSYKNIIINNDKNVSNSNQIKAYQICKDELDKRKTFDDILLEKEFYLYQLFNQLKYEKDDEDFIEDENSIQLENNNSIPMLSKNTINFKTNFNLQLENFENEYLNSTVIKTLQSLIIKMLELNVDEKLTKILVRLFTRINSQRKEIIDYIKNIHLIYESSDLKKYSDCNRLIKDLSLFTEKTEIWMQPELIGKIKLNTQDNEKNVKSSCLNEFQKVLNIIEKLNIMYYRKSEMTQKSIEDILLTQTICFSLKLDEILFNLLREICQVYPINIIKGKTNPTFIFKEDLSKLIKIIFKLLNSMVYNSKNFQEIIQNNFLSFKSYDFLFNLGYLNLIKEIVSVNPKFALENGQFIMEIVKKECSVENFLIIFEKFKSVEQINKNLNENIKINNHHQHFVKSGKFLRKINTTVQTKLDRKKFESDLSRIVKILKLVNRFVNCIKDDKYLSPILRLYEEILKNLSLNDSFVKITNNDLMSKKFNKILTKKLKVLCQLIKIGYNLIQINEKLKGLIKKLFPTSVLEEKILILELGIDDKKLEELIEISKVDNIPIINKNNIIENDENIVNGDNYNLITFVSATTPTNIFTNYFSEFSITSMFKNFYSMKYYGCILFSLTSYELQHLKDPEKIKFYFNILEKDLEKYKLIKKQLIKLPKDKIQILETFKKSAYKYFFKGIYNIIYNLSGMIKPELFKDNSEGEIFIDDLRQIMKIFRQVFKDFIKETNSNFYKSLIAYILKENQKFKDLFGDFNLNSLEENNIMSFKIDRLVIENNLLHINNGNENDDDNLNYELDLTIAFTEDFIFNIENFPETKAYIENEITILAKKLKSKINFHHLVYYYINNNQSMANYTNSNFHLINIFLKFIQENYLSTKYYAQIIFLIQLFANFINAEVEFLNEYDLEGKKQLDNFYIEQKKGEINEICLNYCQNIFLNNGAVEIFLKIICESNHNFNQNIYPTLLKFFNMVLQGGNKQAQDKFYELFYSFNNSDNLFFYIKQMFNWDIYLFLRNEVNTRDIKTDYFYDELMKNQLKFLQSLTENHYTNLQLFLREQFSNKVSYNFITIIVDYMNMLLSKMNIVQDKKGLDKYITQFYYGRIISCLETLCEFLQGPCPINQENIINSKIIEIFDKILRETEFSEILSKIESPNYENKMKVEDEDEEFITSQNSQDEMEELIMFEKYEINNNDSQKLFYYLTQYEKSHLIYKIGLVLLAIVEGRRTKDEIIQKLMRDFDYKLVYDKLTELYYKIRMVYQNEMEFFLYFKHEDDFIDDKIVVEAGFNLYVFLSLLFNFETCDSEFKRIYIMFNRDTSKSNENVNFEKDNFYESNMNILAVKKAMLFYKENCLRIEILKDDVIQTVYFPKLNIFKNLTDEMIRNFREKANRSSAQTKLNSLLSYKDDLYTTLSQLYDLEKFFKKLSLIRFLFMYPKIYLSSSIIMGIIMNILILIGYSTVSEGADDVSLVNRVQLFGLNQQSKFNNFKFRFFSHFYDLWNYFNYMFLFSFYRVFN